MKRISLSQKKAFKTELEKNSFVSGLRPSFSTQAGHKYKAISFFFPSEQFFLNFFNLKRIMYTPNLCIKNHRSPFLFE